MDKRLENSDKKQDQIIATFDKFATAMIDRLNSIDEHLSNISRHGSKAKAPGN